MDWREKYADKWFSLEEAAKKVKPGSVVMGSMGVGVPYELLNALTMNVDHFTLYFGYAAQPFKTYLPPYNQRITTKNWFYGPVERLAETSKQNADLFYQPMHLSDMTFDRLGAHKPDVLIIECTEPDENGLVSQGVCPLPMNIVTDDTIIIAQYNNMVPYVKGEGTMIPADRIDYWCEAHAHLYAMNDTFLKPSEQEVKIAELVAERVNDGDCVQFGIGTFGFAVGRFLLEKKHLGIHSEMFVESMKPLIESGAVDGSRKQIDKGKVLFSFGAGSRELYEFMDHNEMLLSRPFSYVNDPRVICQNKNMVAMVSAMEIDLFGQVFAESIGFKQYSGTGGQMDFIKGAHWSEGGRSYVCLPSTYTDKQGKLHSKINLLPHPGAIVSTPRTDVDHVVTEYGCVRIQNDPVDVRCKKLISIAHPDFREKLTKQAMDYHLMR